MISRVEIATRDLLKRTFAGTLIDQYTSYEIASHYDPIYINILINFRSGMIEILREEIVVELV